MNKKVKESWVKEGDKAIERASNTAIERALKTLDTVDRQIRGWHMEGFLDETKLCTAADLCRYGLSDIALFMLVSQVRNVSRQNRLKMIQTLINEQLEDDKSLI